VPTGAFQASDIKTLIDLELRKRVGPALSALSEIQDGEDERLPEDTFADIVEAVSSLISAIQIPDPTETGLFNKPFRPRQRNYQLLGREHSGFKMGDPSTASVHFGIIIDPISDTAQKWSSLLQWATNLPGVFVEVYIHPAAYQEVPLKRFYRYNLLSRLQFTETGEESKAVVAFKGLPTAPIYTLAMDAPISWVVRPREALHDLDNIQLSHLDEQDEVKAVFDLDYLVVEGHAREMSTNGAPRGVQLQLTTDEGTIMDDTQVVATLGYLQFKVRPGVFHLEIREGRGREIFTMLSVGNEGWNSPDVGVIGNDITVTSFEGVTLYPRFGRHPGQQDSDVLEDAPTDETQREEDVHQGVFGQVVSRCVGIVCYNHVLICSQCDIPIQVQEVQTGNSSPFHRYRGVKEPNTASRHQHLHCCLRPSLRSILSPTCLSGDSDANTIPALRVNHDTECAKKHEQHSQILVH
jgi:UDP-glucose:glycoprotein glucosyltransferase